MTEPAGDDVVGLDDQRDGQRQDDQEPGAGQVGEREQGVASVSAPVRSPGGKIIAAVSVSGPLERLSRQPGRMHAPAVLAAADRLSESLRRAAAE